MNKFKFAPALIAAAVSTGVFAGADDPSVQIENVNASIPDTGVIVGVSFTNDADAGQEAVAGQFEVVESPDDPDITVTGQVFDAFATAWVDCPTSGVIVGASYQVSCNATPRFILENTSNAPLGSFNFADIIRLSVDVGGGASAGSTPLVLQAENWTLASGTDMAPGEFGGNNANGSVTLAITGGAGYASTPNAGTVINLGAAEIGSTTAPTNVAVSEIGDAQLDVSAFNFGGATPGDFATTAMAFSIADGGAPVDVPLTCTPSSRGTVTANVTFTNNSINLPSATYDLTCIGTSPNVAVSPATINLNGVIGGTNPTGSFDITNAQNGATSDATNAALAESGTAEISIIAGLTDATIAIDETDSVTVECDTATSGMFSETISLTYDDPLAAGGTGQIDVTVNCDIANAVPSFAGTPAAPGPIAFGTVTNGTTSAPIGIDVSNDGVGPSPASDLDIASVTVSDPQFAFIINDNGPFVVGSPAVADAIEVTCSPDAGTTGAFTGTLTINHDGDDNPTTYDLTCAGQSDATFASTPADGGTLNLGVVPPVVMTPPGDITFSNTGAVDSYDISCSVTDPDGVFTFTPDPISFTVAAGASEAATFQCTPAAPQIYQADVACTITGADVATANYAVTCAGQPLVVPTMNRWGLILMALMLLALGGFAGRRMMA